MATLTMGHTINSPGDEKKKITKSYYMYTAVSFCIFWASTVCMAVNIAVCGICGAHGGYETAEVRDVRRNGGGRGLCGGAGKRVGGVFPGRPQSFRHQRRPVDDCSPGRGGMVQNGRTRGGTFYGKMDRCRKNQGLDYGMQWYART